MAPEKDTQYAAVPEYPLSGFAMPLAKSQSLTPKRLIGSRRPNRAIVFL